MEIIQSISDEYWKYYVFLGKKLILTLGLLNLIYSIGSILIERRNKHEMVKMCIN